MHQSTPGASRPAVELAVPAAFDGAAPVTLVYDAASGQPEHAALWSPANDTGLVFRCGHARYEAVRDIMLHLDANGDRCLDRAEMTGVFERCLTWYERAGMRLGSMLGVVETPDTAITDCDVRGNDERVCLEDVLATQTDCERYAAGELLAHTCLCTCTALNDLYRYVFERLPCE